MAAERATGEQIAYLEELVERMDGVTDFASWSELDTLFHLILADATQSQRLTTEVKDLRSRAYDISALWELNPISTLRLSNRGHKAILRAVKARRPGLAQKAMIEHVQTTLAVWLGLQSGMAYDRAETSAEQPPPARTS